LLKAAHCYLDFSRRVHRKAGDNQAHPHLAAYDGGERNRGSNAPL
jgi:hypothetical protein